MSPVAPHLTGPPCSLITAKCSVAPKSTEPRKLAHPGQQGSGCKARWVGHLGTQRSLNTPHPAGRGMQTPSQGPAKCRAGPEDLEAAVEADSGREGQTTPSPLLSSSCLAPGSALGQRSSLSLAAALAGVRGVARRPGRRGPPPGCPSVRDRVTVMRDPAGIQGFQPFVDMSSGPRTRALPHPSPSTRPRIFPSPVLVCTQSSLQPQERQP